MRVGEGAVIVVDDAAVRALGEADDACRRQGAVRVAVVAQHIERGRSRPFVNRQAIIIRHRRIVHRRDVDSHLGRVRQAIVVLHLVDETVRSDIVCGRRVGKRAIVVVNQQTMRRTAHDHVKLRHAVLHVSIVGQQRAG